MKRILTLIAAAALMSGVALAQNPDGEKKCDCKKHERGKHDGIEMVQNKTERMAERYGLDENQKAQLLELNMEREAKHQARPKAQRPEGAPDKSKMKADSDTYDKAVKEILTKDQYKAYKKDIKNIKKNGPKHGPKRDRPVRLNK